MTEMNSSNDDDNVFSLNDHFPEEEDEDETIRIQLSSKTIKVYYYQLYKYSKLIQKEYQKSEIQNRLPIDLQIFQRKYKLSDDSIINFFKMIQDEKIQIDNDQYWDLCMLSHLFKVVSLQKCLLKISKKQSKNINYIIDLMLKIETQENDDFIPMLDITIEMTTHLINSIDQCLQNEKFGKLSIATVYHIIEQCDIEKIPTDLLYDFINQSIDDRYILFRFINIQNLSENRQEEIIENENSMKNYYQYFPSNMKYITTLVQENKCFKEQLNRLKKDKKNLQEQLNKANNNYIALQGQLNQSIDNDYDFKFKIKELKKNENELQIQLNKAKSVNEDLKNRVKKLVKDLNLLENQKNLMLFHEKNYSEIVMSLLSFKNFDLQEKMTDNENLLHLACETGNVELVKFIVSLDRIDIKTKDVLSSFFFLKIFLI